MKCLCRYLAALLAMMALGAAAAPPESAAALIQARVGQLRNGEQVSAAGQPLASSVVLPDFYEQRAFEPAWTDPVNLQALLHAVRDSAGDGLNPRDYHLAALEAVAARPAGPQRDADLDMLATDATLRLAYHLRFGKVDVRRIDANWNFGRDFQALLSIAPVHAIEQTLAQRRVAEALALMRPSQPMYGRLREALARYRALEAAGGWPALTSGKALHPGTSDRRVPALRARLLAEGDLEQLPPQADAVYDAATQAAVQRFQERHGLKPDAIVGGHTLRTLNIPVKWKIDRLRLSLERARLLLRDLPERYVLVNIPAYRLYYTDGSTRFTSNVVVGKMVAKTPIFRAEITHL
ncbi:MAG: peptidoglycan-binding protein, partial [Burkholderiales bacterium]|nr:peptidoglycan-binding protein [Burkholderiales bacterium]